MDSKLAARATADAILDAQSGFPSKHRTQAVRGHCAGTEARITALENELRNTMQELVKLRRQCAACIPIENFD